MRWNGDDDSGSPGNPQSHGNPTWFIVPEELHGAVRDLARLLDQAMGFVTCETTKPADFDYGAFKVMLSVREKLIIPDHILFEIPQLSKRIFQHDQKYSVPPSEPGNSWRGHFVDGIWEGIVRTNGISEDENPTSIHVVKDALVASVMKAIRPWKNLASE